MESFVLSHDLVIVDSMLCTTMAHEDPNKYPDERVIHIDCEPSTVNGKMIDEYESAVREGAQLRI